MFDVAICDDCGVDRLCLKALIEKAEIDKNLIRIHEYGSGEELLEAMRKIKFSLIFLDICMKGMDGEDTAEDIRRQSGEVVLVFYSGKDPTPRAIEMQPYRYIKKSMAKEKIQRYITDALNVMIKNRKIPVITARIGKTELFLRPNEIVFIEKYKKTTRVYISKAAQAVHGVEDGNGHEAEIRISDKLVNLYELLRPYGFGYPHDSYIINFAFLMSCSGSILKIDEFTNTVFKLSRSKAPEFLQRRKDFMLSAREWRLPDLNES